ncbi:MAG: hypothetical protein IPM98_04775 [Lewinellaceae bacterium]|nr:hypothetical protein [Lewinellaceae bacterium]
MANMTAQQELKVWLEQHRQLDNEADREQFFENLLKTLSGKSSGDFQLGLLALRTSVQATRLQAEKTKSVGALQVFPNSYEEQELLLNLLERLAIPYKKSA